MISQNMKFNDIFTTVENDFVLIYWVVGWNWYSATVSQSAMNPLTFKEDGSNFVFDTLKFTFLQIQISLSRKQESFMWAILPKHDLRLQ